MKVQVDIRLPRRRRLLVAAAVLALVVGVPTALAIHQFADVPTANPHHDDISALVGAGITVGCAAAPLRYCPSDPVRRDQMATFLRRGFGRVAYDFRDAGFLTTTDADAAVVTIQVGGAPGQTQFVKLDGTFTAWISSSSGCPCTSGFHISQDGGASLLGSFHYVTNDQVGSGSLALESGATTAVVAVPSGTTQTFRLRARRIYNTGGTVAAWGNLTAIVAPFGSTGANVIGATSPRPTGLASGSP